VFFIAAAVYLFGTVFYGIFGSGQRQPWGIQAPQPVEEEPEDKDKDTGT